MNLHARRDYLETHPISDDLREFAESWLERPIIRPPTDAFYEDHNAVLFTFHRDVDMQVELFVAKPNVIIPTHKHPHIESYDVFMFGAGVLTVGDSLDALFQFNTRKTTREYHRAMGNAAWLNRDTWHGGETTDVASTYITFQKWYDMKPTHVANDWIDEFGNTAPTDGRK